MSKRPDINLENVPKQQKGKSVRLILAQFFALQQFLEFLFLIFIRVSFLLIH